jgi:hypothetical protein
MANDVTITSNELEKSRVNVVVAYYKAQPQLFLDG